MNKKFEMNRREIKGGCQSGRKVAPHNSKSDLPLAAGNATVPLQVRLATARITALCAATVHCAALHSARTLLTLLAATVYCHPFYRANETKGALLSIKKKWLGPLIKGGRIML